MTIYCKLKGKIKPNYKTKKVVFKLECFFSGNQKQFLESLKHSNIHVELNTRGME